MARVTACGAEPCAALEAVDAKAGRELYEVYSLALSWGASTAKRLRPLGVLWEQPLAEARRLRTDAPFR